MGLHLLVFNLLVDENSDEIEISFQSPLFARESGNL